MDNKYLVTVVSIVVAIIVLAGVLMPVINMASGGETTIHITNEDASTLTLQKATSGFALALSVTTDDGDLVIANGSDTMTVDPNESFFIVATDSAAIYHDQGDTICVWTSDGVTQTRELTAPFTAVIADNKLTVDDGTSTDLPLPSSYMFSPSSTGGYGSFTAPDLNLVPNDPVIAAGTFAGVYCYNENTTIGNALQEYVTVSDDVLTEVIWGKPTPVVEPQIIIQPLDPSIIGPFNPIDPGQNVIMAVATPTYTDGDWGYDIVQSNKAAIVSYSGAGGGAITIPSTIGGYPVVQVGQGNDKTVFNTTLTATDLIIPSGVTMINYGAFKGCSGLTGSLTIPSTVTEIRDGAFYGCSGLTGSLTIPSGVTSIGEFAFFNCSGFTGTLTIPSGVTSIGQQAFFNCSGLTGSLTIPSGVTSIGASTFSGCSGLTGSLTIPSGVTSIGNQAFNGCSGFTGSLTIPDSVTYIDSYAFRNCSGFTGTLVLPDNLSTVNTQAFRGCSNITGLVVITNATLGNEAFRQTGITEILNLSENDMTNTPYLTGAELRQGDDAYIEASLYLAPADVAITEGTPSPFAPILSMIPLFIVIAILMVAVGFVMVKRNV